MSAQEVFDRTNELAALHAELFPPEAASAPGRSQRPTLTLSDQEVLRRMFAARNGSKLRSFYDGDVSGYGGDDSRADEALCFHLAFWTAGNADQIDRLFRGSGLFRPKWERADYRERTLDHALSSVQDYYGSRIHTNGPSGERNATLASLAGTMPPRTTAAATYTTTVEAPDFWRSRPELELLHNFALARRASPWAVLGVAYARIVAATPPSWLLPPLIGDVASLNLFVALVGASGAGKGAGERAASAAVSFGDVTPFNSHTPGSGQGVAHAFGHYDAKAQTMVRHAIAAYFSLDEVDHLEGLFGQKGSTLRPELRRLFMGEALGHLYVDPTRRVEIAPHSYRASLVAAVQPERAGVLIDDAGGGTPQRFVWLPTTYPHPDSRPLEPEPLEWRLPALPQAGPYIMPVCYTAANAIDNAYLARARGEGDALDGHLLLTQEKVAAALALLSGGIEVGDEDWQLAAEVMAISLATRDGVAAVLAEQAARRENGRAERAVRVQQRLDDDAEARAFAAAQRQAVNHVSKHAGVDGCKVRCITQAIAGKYRIGLSLDELLADALARNLMTLSRDGKLYFPNGSAP